MRHESYGRRTTDVAVCVASLTLKLWLEIRLGIDVYITIYIFICLFKIYLMLSVAQNVYRRLVGWLLNNEFERISKEEVVA
jgi:hypothetical protein